MWTAISQAFSMVFDPYTLLVMVLASMYGLFVGAVPGLTATMATALLVPVTFFMAPIPAIAAIVTRAVERECWILRPCRWTNALVGASAAWLQRWRR